MVFSTVQKWRNAALGDSGQASAEYLIAACTVLIVIAALAGLVGFFAGTGDSKSMHSKKTYMRAPYTISGSEGGSEQWVKDLLVH